MNDLQINLGPDIKTEIKVKKLYRRSATVVELKESIKGKVWSKKVFCDRIADNLSTRHYSTISKSEINLEQLAGITSETVLTNNNNISLLNRRDVYGVPIVKGSKEHKVTFYDVLTRKDIATIVNIDSYKDNKNSNKYKTCGCESSCMLI